MTNEEAKKYIERAVADGSFGCIMKPMKTEVLKISIDAIDKQIPKKMECYEDKFMHCPICKEALGYKWKKYPAEKEDFSWLRFCWNCGQKIEVEE